jgi:hypothetical protein
MNWIRRSQPPFRSRPLAGDPSEPTTVASFTQPIGVLDDNGVVRISDAVDVTRYIAEGHTDLDPL